MKIGNNNRRTINKIAVPIIAVNIPAALKNRNDSINTIESIVGMSLKANLVIWKHNHNCNAPTHINGITTIKKNKKLIIVNNLLLVLY